MLSLLIAGFALLMLISAFYDAATMTIPNWISGALVVLFIIIAPLAGLSWHEIGLHAASGFGILVLTIIMFSLRWIGGGDAKLFAAGALWIGWPTLLLYVIYTALAGGVLTLFLLVVRKYPMPAFLVRWKWSARLLKHGGDVPYGIGICVGALLALPETSLFLTASAG
jgi:prepilin peptidase CpaA